ncbi:MAG: hypothetical protein LBC74_11515 [Planctomycetaceae bacterium]|nr:hypothetical protein [Planctomycetaceae bacterium]
MNLKIYFIGLLLAVVVIFSGCGSKGVQTVKVTGNITIDGNQIEQGSVKFIDVEGKTPTGGGSISKGTYAANVPLGKKKILVLGTKLVGKEPLFADMPDSPVNDKYEQVTPDAYNSFELTPLEAEITAAIDNLNFDLLSKFRK